MIRAAWVFALLLATLVLLAQTRPVTIVDAESGEAIADCYIYTEGQTHITQSDPSGAFDYGKFDGTEKLFFLHSSYVKAALTPEEIEHANFTIRLTPVKYTTGEVVIEGYRFGKEKSEIPQQISEVTARDVARENPRTAADMLENGGVFVQRSQFGGGSPMIRGFTANQVLLVVDGVRLNNAIYRSGNLQNSITLDANALGSADILFGPGSVQYGSDAMGGVMIFNTLDPLPSLLKQTKIGVNAFTRYATAAQEKTAGATAQFGLRKWALLAGFTYSDFGDLRSGRVLSDAYPDYGRRREYVTRINGEDVIVANERFTDQKPSGYTQSNIMGKVRYFHNAHLNATYALLYTTSSDIPRYDRLEQYRNGALRYAEWYYGPQQWLMNRLSLHASSGAFYDEATLTLAHQDYQESRHDRARDNDNINHRTEDVAVVSVNADLGKRMGSGELFYGIETVFNDVQSSAEKENIVTGEIAPQSTRYPDGGSNTTSLAAYGGWRTHVSSNIVMTTGLRYTQNMLTAKFEDKSFYNFPFDEITYNSGAPTASLGAVCSLDSWQVRGVVSSGFRAPNVDDVGKVFDSGDGIVIFPNPDLSSEYSYNGELGLERSFGSLLTVSSTGYYSLLQDAVVVRDSQFNGQDSIEYDGAMAKVKSLQNAGNAYLTGFDFSARARLTSAFSFSSSLSYGAGHDKENDLPMRPVPPLFGQTSLLYEATKWTGELYARYNNWKQLHDMPVAGGEVTAYTPDGVPSWWTLNLRGTVKPVQHLELVCALENILDRHYRPYGSGISAPGRNFVVSLRAAI
ncbi:TonB-dependent receptor [bacterium]|nr:TonB-dependent receptor [bacterium]